MRLRVRSWGTDPRTAVLVHGFSDDSDTWWRVGPAVAELGFTVLAPDLRGHGHSPRAGSYALEDFAADLVETLPAAADLAIGHSLGALVLGLAAPRLQPRRAVFLDPPWLRQRGEVQLEALLPTTPHQLPDQWCPEDVAADLASNARIDPAVVPGLMAVLAADERIPAPPALHPGTLVLVPELDPSLPPGAHAAVVALGYQIVTQPGVGHVMHRDDFSGFMDLLRPQLAERDVAA